MSRFIIIPRIQVQRANAQTSYLTTNAAFVMPSLMLAHALGRKIGVAIKGVSYIHHDFQMLGELQYGKMMPHQRRGAVFIDSDDYSSKNKYALSLQPTASCHVTITLIIELDDGRFEFSDVERFVQKAKFAGGDIIRHGKIESANMIDDKTIKTGFYLIDRSDLMTQERTLETFISTLGQPFSEEKIIAGSRLLLKAMPLCRVLVIELGQEQVMSTPLSNP